MENTKMNLTGKPSVDKPWLQFYPEQLRNVEVPKMTIEEFLNLKTRMKIELRLNIMEIKLHGRRFGKRLTKQPDH